MQLSLQNFTIHLYASLVGCYTSLKFSHLVTKNLYNAVGSLACELSTINNSIK